MTTATGEEEERKKVTAMRKDIIRKKGDERIISRADCLQSSQQKYLHPPQIWYKKCYLKKNVRNVLEHEGNFTNFPHFDSKKAVCVCACVCACVFII